MELACLKGLIGLHKDYWISGSGLYVNTLPGISVHNIRKIADKTEQIDAERHPDPKIVFEECEERAIIQFRGTFIAAMAECWNLFDLDVAECLICKLKNKLATSLWWYIGHEIMVERIGSDRLNRFTTIDTKKAENLRDEMLQRADYILQSTVRGIDPNTSDCGKVEQKPCGTFIIHKVLPCL